MLGNLFNSPTQLLLLLLVIVLLFGATRLPNAARQVGRSMRIFKSEMKEMKADGADEGTDPSDVPREADRDAPRGAAPLEGRVLREDHAPRTTTEPGTTSDGLRRDA